MTALDEAQKYANLHLDHDNAAKEARAARTREENLEIELISQLRVLGKYVGRNVPRKVFPYNSKYVLLVEWGGVDDQGRDKLPNCQLLPVEVE